MESPLHCPSKEVDSHSRVELRYMNVMHGHSIHAK